VRRALFALALGLALGLLAVPAPGSALAAQAVSVSAAFAPERLGAPTAVTFGFEVHAVNIENAFGFKIPSPLTGIDFHYPADLGLGTSGLGLATCNEAALQIHGPSACPANSIMGSGGALAEFQVSPEVEEETAQIALVAGPSPNGYLNMLISATGVYPVAARIIMSTLLEPGQLKIIVPLVPGVVEGPDVAVIRAHVTIGGNLTYYRRSHGKKIAYRPQGILLPRSCPKGGFHFTGTFTFLDASHVNAQTVVKCPRR
jgi:hypothetical protein